MDGSRKPSKLAKEHSNTTNPIVCETKKRTCATQQGESEIQDGCRLKAGK
jgi:hypothetical protein